MKRKGILLLTLICLLTACGKSEGIKKVEESKHDMEVQTDIQGYDSSYYAFDVYVVLKPDGSIYIENTSNAEFPLPVGTYR